MWHSFVILFICFSKAGASTLVNKDIFGWQEIEEIIVGLLVIPLTQKSRGSLHYITSQQVKKDETLSLQFYLL